jgi:spore coat protein U-like protein
MMRVLLAAYCLLLSASALAASPASALPQGRGPGSRAPGGGGGTCPAFPAQCQINAPTFNFGRATMNQTTPPIYGNAMISVTCTRHPQDRLEVSVEFDLKGVVVQQPPRQMRDQIGGAYLAYDMYLDAARTRLWGDGVSAGTEFFTGYCFLDERNRVCTVPFVLYGKVNGQQAVVPPGPYLGAVPARLEFRFGACIP